MRMDVSARRVSDKTNKAPKANARICLQAETALDEHIVHTLICISMSVCNSIYVSI